jgi:regulator of sirC expression with transglutaminase-like and TPR domain
MATLMPFAVQAGCACPPHAELALALAAEFRDVDVDGADAGLDALAARIGDVGELSPGEQLDVCAAAVATDLAPAGPTWGSEDLFLDVGLQERRGHPAVLAAICVEAGRRAGVPLGIVATRGRWLVAHPQLEEDRLVDPRRGRALRASALASEPTWRCAHQLSLALLDELCTRARTTGDLMRAIRAAELRLALPLDARGLSRQRDELGALRARLN